MILPRSLKTLAFAVASAGALHAADFAGPAVPAAPSLDEAWRTPPPEARLRAYWWWLNGNVDRAAITRDLEQMKSKGFGGAVIFDAGGADQRSNGRVPAGPAYGSPEWRALVRHALAEGDRLGLEMSLNIMSGWNLGGPGVSVDDAVKKLVYSEMVIDGPGPIAGATPVPPAVSGTRESLAIDTTVRVDIALPAPPVVGGVYHDLFVLAYPLSADKAASGGITNWKQKTLEAKLDFKGPNAWFLANSAPNTDALVREEPDRPGEADVTGLVDVTKDLGADGRLRWTPRDGRWQVIRFGYTLGDVHEVSTSSDTWKGYAIDVFDRGAFERYWASSVAPVLDDLRAFAGRSLRYLHTDSWEVDLVNWTPTLREEFVRRRGYDPLPYMPAFAGKIVGTRSATQRFLNDYRRTLGDLAFDNHYVPFRDLAAKYGLGIHPESGGPHYTPIDAQRCLGINDVPMSEFWAQSATHRTTEEVRFFVKQPASAAHTYGKRFVSAEGFTSVGPHWQETLWDNLKPSFDHAIGEGLNRLVWHAFVCSPESMGIPGQQYFAGTHFNPNVTWWEQSDAFLAYLNRVTALMQRGLFVADALYYYGDHVPNFARSRASDPARLGAGYDYDVINEEALLERVSVRDGRLVLPDGMSYRLLVLPNEREISLPVLRKLRELIEAGATVLGPKPQAASTLGGQPAGDEEVRRLAAELWDKPVATGQGRVIADRTAREVLQADGVPPDVEFKTDTAGAEFDSMHRRDGDADIYFVANRRKEPVNVAVSFRVSGKAPELWNPVTAAQQFAAAYRANGGVTTVPLELPAFGSMLVVFREPASRHPVTAATNAAAFAPVSDLSGSWTVSFDPKWGGPESATFDTLASWTDRSEPGIRNYSGKATYQKSFTVTDAQTAGALWLDLGLARELAVVRVNGHTLGTLWAPPFRVDVSGAVRAGENQLEIDVVNFWPNRIIGDASLPPEKRLTRTNVLQLKANTPLMPSGLLGPVRLLTPIAERPFGSEQR